MWGNYILVGLRALAKNKTYAFINIFGLALGLAACLLLLLYVRYETSYDSWLPEADRTYQLQQSSIDMESGNVMRWQATAYAAGVALQKDFPQVEKTVYMMEGSPKILQDGQATAAEDVRFTDGNLFEIIELPFLQGDRRTALSEPDSVVLSQSEAVKRFGTDQILGRTLTFVRDETSTDYRVTGVFRDIPKNSHLKMSMVARFDPETYYGDDTEAFMTSWGWVGGPVYVRLKPGADPEQIHAAMPAWEKRNIPNWVDGPQVTNAGTTDDWTLVNVRDVHLGAAQDSSMTPGNDRGTITTFTIVALLILALACINFVNLATARASQRAREVALRKVLGANRRQLILQFLGESLLVTLIAMLAGLALVEIGLPALSAYLEADLQMRYLGADGMLLPILALIAFVAVAGGLYPAFYLSRFQPAKVLKANRSASDTAGSGRLRTILVVAQFAISIGLIVCTAVIYSQTLYARTVDPGYNRDGLLQVTGFSRAEVDAQRESIAAEVARVDGVTSIAWTNLGVDRGGGSDFFVYRPGNSKPFRLFTHRIDTRFFPTMGMEMLAGRNFSEAQGKDVGVLDPEATPEQRQAFAQRGMNVILNASGARRLGFANPASAVGQPLLMPDLAGEEYGQIPATIVGIVNDARFGSVRDPVQPSVFRYAPSGLPFMEVRFTGVDPKSVREGVERVWQRYVPDVPFEGDFTDDIIGELYSAETARGQIFAGFALFAVFIGCMGLFGLAAFTAERRTREIGIRKVLGARSRDIVQLLVWQFTRPVLLANLIAWPAAWWVMRDWLNGFDSRIDLTPTPFVIAGLLALGIAVATVAGHAMRIARTNPIHALRYE